MERRSATRNPLFRAIRLRSADGKPHVAISKEVSRTGLLLGSAHKFETGDMVLVSGANQGEEIPARVVRQNRNPRAETILWRYLVALRFDTPAAGERFLQSL